MRIELSNLTHVPELSEETYCFTADLIADGAIIARATNRGQGGATIFTPLPDMRDRLSTTEKWAKTLPTVKVNNVWLPMDLELYVFLLIENQQ